MSKEAPKTKTRASARPTKRPAAQRQKRGANAKEKAPRTKVTPDDLKATIAAHRVPVIAGVVVLALFVAMYGPACGLYQAWRENGLLQAEQERTSSESSELEGDISSLMTEEGIKDEARRKYINELFAYWRYYYQIRSLTLWDFAAGRGIDADFEALVR